MNLVNAIRRLKSQRYDQAVIAAVNFEPNAICIEDFRGSEAALNLVHAGPGCAFRNVEPAL
jgi:hypothetical protein